MADEPEQKKSVRSIDKDYFEAVDFFKTGEYDKAVKAAEGNLADPMLPRWHQIRNHILWACATDDWIDGERHRRIAEKIYAESAALTGPDELEALDALEKIRSDLDELAVWQEEDRVKNEAEFEELQEKLRKEKTGVATAAETDERQAVVVATAAAAAADK